VIFDNQDTKQKLPPTFGPNIDNPEKDFWKGDGTTQHGTQDERGSITEMCDIMDWEAW